VLIIGAGGHAQVVADILMTASRQGAAHRPCGYLDHDEKLWGTHLLDIPVIGSIDDCDRFEHDAVVVGIGDNLTRRGLFERLALSHQRFVTVRHPAAIISSHSVIRHGSVICPGVIVNARVCIGPNVILNTGCSVDHHTVIGDHAHIAPGARLGGHVTIGQGTLIGMGAMVLPGRKIGAWSVVGAGAVVTQDLPDGVIAVGSPARTHTKPAAPSLNH
jgi:sugar O-acyltransferase (sialic acid O-acetyltransferase NeuD family)